MQGCWAGRGAVLVLKGSTNMCVLVNLESGLCVPALVNFYCYQPKRRKGTCLFIYKVLLKATLCLWQSV